MSRPSHLSLELKRQKPQHPLANNTPSLGADDSAPLAQSGFHHEMERIDPAQCRPVKSICLIEATFRWFQLSFKRCPKSPAQEHIHPLERLVPEPTRLTAKHPRSRAL